MATEKETLVTFHNQCSDSLQIQFYTLTLDLNFTVLIQLSFMHTAFLSSFSFSGLVEVKHPNTLKLWKVVGNLLRIIKHASFVHLTWKNRERKPSSFCVLLSQFLGL